MDIKIPANDVKSVKNLLDRIINNEKIKIIRNKIPIINNEVFKRIKAYVGTIFSFQWSLIFSAKTICNTFVVTSNIEFK